MMVLTAKDEWVRAAMTDDSVVVELLVRLKQAQAQPVAKSVAVAALRWGIRQPRSRSSSSLASMRCDGAVSQRVGKGGDSANSNLMRASPTTPLSWSGGGGGAVSPSATADAFEETSRQQTSSGARSKMGIAANETTSNATKRSRRKKTYAELKEEEGLLLKERVHLKKEIETLRATFKEHNAANVNLKRMKLDLGVDSAKNPSEAASDDTQKTISDQVHKVAIKSSLPSFSSIGDIPQSESCESHKAASIRSSQCVLPDLNMMPSEDDSGSETLYGASKLAILPKCKYFNLRQVLQTHNYELCSPMANSLEGKRKLTSVMKKVNEGSSLEIVASRP